MFNYKKPFCYIRMWILLVAIFFPCRCQLRGAHHQLDANEYSNSIIAEAGGKTILGSVSYERHFGEKVDTLNYRPWNRSWEIGFGLGVGALFPFDNVITAANYAIGSYGNENHRLAVIGGGSLSVDAENNVASGQIRPFTLYAGIGYEYRNRRFCMRLPLYIGAHTIAAVVRVMPWMGVCFGFRL